MLRHGLARVALGLIPVAAAIAPLALPRVAQATPNSNPITITPDTFLDVASPDCSLVHLAGSCSLRGAVIRANNDAGDNIQLLAGTYHLSIAPTGQADDGTSGDLELSVFSAISGAGADKTTIAADANFGDRVLETSGPMSPQTAISNLTIEEGSRGRLLQ